MSIYEILSTLADTSKTNAKIQILQDNKDNKELSLVFERALNPTVKYYIKKIPAYTKDSETLTLAQGIQALSQLSERKLTGNAGIDRLFP